ncbi:MAG: hypothetical protein KAY32_03845 [Candidatus Eisenbacteria sp.]|nr:hypothetical protein [Candidatus Eisenbacteria bacterium]
MAQSTISIPFLTLEDPNAKIKGSRDPLGIVPIWSAFGRHVVTNVISVSTSVRGFTVLLLGRYFSGRLIEERIVPREEALNIVLRMEQAGAYARYVGHRAERDIRGIERVKRFLDDGKGKVHIQSDPRGFILADQKVYGLWGLYTVAARRSGWLPDLPLGVLSPAREFIEKHYIAPLDAAVAPLMRLLARGGVLDTRKGGDAVFKGVVRILPETFSPAEVAFYGGYLRDSLGNHDGTLSEGTEGKHGRQARFRPLLEEHTDLDQPVNRDEILALAKAARLTDEGLSHALWRIAHLEALLAPATALFDFVSTRNGQTPSEIAGEMRKRWGEAVPNLDGVAFQDLLAEIAEVSNQGIATVMHRTHRALASGDYEEAVRAILEWNKGVQEGRKGGPWIVLTDAGRTDVRYRGMDQFLPEKEELPTLWRNSYFIDAIKSITKQLRRTAP